MLLVNLISYPSVWGFFPSLRQFHYSNDPIIGLIALSVSIVYGFLLVRILLAEDSKSRKKLIVGTVISAPFAIITSLYVVFVLTYGNHEIDAWGLSQFGVVFFAEALAILGEGAIYWRTVFRDQERSIRRSLALSALNNIASLLVGWLIFYGPFA